MSVNVMVKASLTLTSDVLSSISDAIHGKPAKSRDHALGSHDAYGTEYQRQENGSIVRIGEKGSRRRFYATKHQFGAIQ